MSSHVIKDYEDMRQDILKRLRSFIVGGYTGGFSFDEECAEELQELEDRIIFVFDKQLDEIDVLKDALSHAQYKLYMRKDRE